MRSRDGSKTFSFSVSAVIIFLIYPLALNAGEYLISYRYVVKNAILYNETLLISKAMTKCLGREQKSILLDTYGKDNLKQIVLKNSDIFLPYIQKLGLQIDSRSQSIDFKNSSTTILTLHTRCFKVDINENLAKITPLN